MLKPTKPANQDAYHLFCSDENWKLYKPTDQAPGNRDKKTVKDLFPCKPPVLLLSSYQQVVQDEIS